MTSTLDLQFDVVSLQQYLREHLECVGPLSVEKFAGGQSNPTYRITSANGQRYVLRKKPAGKLLDSAHAVDREFRITRALHHAGFPVARPHHFCADESVIGTPFYVMDFVDGRVLRDQSLPGMTPRERAAIWDELNRVIAELHSLDRRALGLEDYGKQGSYLGRQVSRWSRQYRATETVPIEAMDRLIHWLPDHIPAGDETSIVHGDFRLENLILHHSEPRVLAVLDWELSTLGHPLADLAYTALSWHLPANLFGGMAALDLGSLGIPTESEFVKTYCARTGRTGIDEDTWRYCVAYNLFRVAAIAQGIARRALDGNAASAAAQEVGRTARPIADLGWAVVERITAARR
jgi:aminoglycoside phosphotransferase (APT) family kinase protein